MAKQLIKLQNRHDEILFGYAWNCKQPKANIMIFTGMQETAERYDDFARYLNSNDFDVYCIDHYGQGLNIKDGDVRGIWPKNGFSRSVKTFAELDEKLQKTGLPIYIFAHSMGSFMAQDYMQRFPNKSDKVILCGTDYANPLIMGFAHTLASVMVNKDKRDLPNEKLAKLVTGSFAKKIKNRRTDFDWLSHNKENVDKYIKDPKCGFIATGGFYKDFLKGMKMIGKKKYLSKVHKGTSVLIIAGEEDPVGHMGKGPKKLYKKYISLGLRDVTLKLYKNMRHEILNETNNKIVYKEIVDFYNK